MALGTEGGNAASAKGHVARIHSLSLIGPKRCGSQRYRRFCTQARRKIVSMAGQRNEGAPGRLAPGASSMFQARLPDLYGITTVLKSIVTAPIRARALPISVAPVSRVID